MDEPFSLFYHTNDSYDIDRILRTNPIIDVARELGLSVNKTVIPCVKRENHVNKNGPPTMTFNLLKNTFKCWVCPNVGGNVIDLIMLVKNVDRQRAIDFLAMRSEIKTDQERKSYVTEQQHHRTLSLQDRESIFQDFLNNLEGSRGIDLIAFASTKGGTGKSLIVNNLAVIISLIARYISLHRETTSQLVELIDLDFGKPDQRLLLGIEPEYFIEDIFNKQSSPLNWDAIRVSTPAENLKLISACPVRKSTMLYYLRKNEVLYMLHNSNAHIKLADFGGGSDKDTLDFLSSIRSKIFVINPDRASVEAVFNLILVLLYYPMKQRFKNSNEALNLIEQLRNCQRTGFTVNDIREGFHDIDKNKNYNGKLAKYYTDVILPFKSKLNIPANGNSDISDTLLKEDLDELRQKVYQILFNENGNGGSELSFTQKSALYRTYNEIEQRVRRMDSYSHRLEEMLKTTLFGLIINKSDAGGASTIADELVSRVATTFSMELSHLGTIPEEKAIRNVSNYGMPFIIYDAGHPVLEYFFAITDTIISLKPGSTARIICEQQDYISALRAKWVEQLESAHTAIK